MTEPNKDVESDSTEDEVGIDTENSGEVLRRIDAKITSHPQHPAIETRVGVLADITDEHTSTITAELTNVSDSELELVFPSLLPLGEGSEWRLLPLGVLEGPRESNCWAMEENEVVLPDELDNRSLDPDETTTTRAELWGDLDNRDCMPTGEYRFSNWLELQDEEEDRLRWEFSVSVTKP